MRLSADQRHMYAMNLSKNKDRPNARYRINLFGSIQVRSVNGKNLRCTSQKAIAILCYLALSDEEKVPKKRLRRLLWGQRFSEQSQFSLRQAVSTLRRSVFFDKKNVIGSDKTNIWLDRSAIWIDRIDSLTEKSQNTISPSHFLEEIEGISKEFDEWIAKTRTSLCKNTEVFIKPNLIDSAKEGVSIIVSEFEVFGSKGNEVRFGRVLQQEVANELSRARWIDVHVGLESQKNYVGYFLGGLILFGNGTNKITLQLLHSNNYQKIVWFKDFYFSDEIGIEFIEEISSKVVSEVDPEIHNLELRNAKTADNESRSFNGKLMIAVSRIYDFEEVNWRKAEKTFGEYHKLFPRNSRVNAYRSLHLITGLAQGWVLVNEENISLVNNLAETATTIDPKNSIALSIRGHIESFINHDFDKALGLFDIAHVYNPNCGISKIYRSLTHSYIGNVKTSAELLRDARQVLVYDPYWSFIDACESVRLFFANSFQSQCSLAQSVLCMRPTFTNIRKIKIMSHCMLEEPELALKEFDTLILHEKDFNWDNFFSNYPWYSLKFKHKVRERIDKVFEQST